MKKEEFVIFGLSGSKKIAENVAKELGVELGHSDVERFRNGEIFFNTKTSVRGKKVFVIQSTSNPVNENIMELLIFLDVLRRTSVEEVTVIIPYFGYSRQDRKANGREPITASLVSNLIQSIGVSRVVSFDFHSSQIQGFFSIPVDELKSVGIMSKKVKELKLEDITIIAPDHGGVKRARSLAKLLNAPLAIIDKRRNIIGEIQDMFLLGDVKNRNCIIVDDMVDSGNTIIEAIKVIKENGAKTVSVSAVHSILSGKNENEVLDNMFAAGIDKYITTNTIQHTFDDKYKDKVVIVDISSAIAGIIKTHLKKESITDYFIKKYNTAL